MAVCDTSTIDVGRNTLVEFVEACGDAEFENLTYKLFGTTNTKSLNFTSSTTDTTNDQSGADTSTVVTRRDGEISVGGFSVKIDSIISNQIEYEKYYHAELDAGRQPSVWIRVSSPNGTVIRYIFCVITSLNLGWNTDDPDSFETSLKPTDTGIAGVPAFNIVDVAP